MKNTMNKSGFTLVEIMIIVVVIGAIGYGISKWLCADIEPRPSEIGWFAQAHDNLANGFNAKYYILAGKKWELDKFLLQIKTENASLRASKGESKTYVAPPDEGESKASVTPVSQAGSGPVNVPWNRAYNQEALPNVTRAGSGPVTPFPAYNPAAGSGSGTPVPAYNQAGIPGGLQSISSNNPYL